MSGKIIADIVSHEVGHNLGLSHDGLAVRSSASPTAENSYYMGAGAWAPIMGAGYDTVITHWSPGDYTGISQRAADRGAIFVGDNTEDDYAVMQYYGLELRADDSGDTRATATSIPVVTVRTGVIEDPADIDYYSFVATGTAHTVTVTSPALTGNLDTLLTVESSIGTELARSNPVITWPGGNTVNGMGATVTVNTTVGTRYFVAIQGTSSNAAGVAVFSDYGSIGEYRLDITTASLAFTTTPTPLITGTARVGAALTAVPGSWSPNAAFSYEWKRGSTTVGTSSTYTPTSSDRGSTLTVTVTGSAMGYTSVSKVSAASSRVGYGIFATSPVPTISGVARVGSVLSAVPGTWSPSAALTYAWKRGTTVVGTSSTYTPTSLDRGSTLTVTVTGSATGYTTASVTSSVTAVVGYGVIAPTPTPTISGKTTVGSTLRAVAGTWPSGVSLSYRWDRCSAITSLCSPIPRATKSDYRVTTSDRGFTFRVAVTGSQSGYTPVTVTSTFAALAAR
jgi:hypothetical protein